jgi:hypothetical protein
LAEVEGKAQAPERAPAVAPSRDQVPGTGSGAPRPGYVAAVLGLQASAGNQAVVELLRGGAAAAGNASGGVSGALLSGAWRFGRHPEFPVSMGQTWYAHNDIEAWPSFNLEYSRSFIPPFPHQAKPRTTDAIGAAWPVLATPESEEGYKMPQPHPDHPGLDYYIRVSGTAANNIAFAEQQHVNDLDEGWSLTGLAAKRAINQVAGEGWAEGDDLAAAKAAAVDKTVAAMGGLGAKVKSNLEGGGSLESSLGPMMDKSFTQTKSQRDASGKHTIPVVYVTKHPDGTKVLYEADPNKAPDSTATSSVVNLGTIG